MGRDIFLAVDESFCSRIAVEFAAHHILQRHPKGHDQLHLVTVLPPIHICMVPGFPLASGATMGLLEDQRRQERNEAEKRAKTSLRKMAAGLAQDYKIPPENLHIHVLPPAMGASGVGESLVEAARKFQADLLVLGTRGMGSIKRSLMSIIGMGSVSDYCLHHSLLPVLIVRPRKPEDLVVASEASPPPPTPEPKRVLVATDGSPHSNLALSWSLDNVVSPLDHLHLITAVMPPPFPYLDEPAAVAAAERLQYDKECQESAEEANQVAARAVEQALHHGVLRTKIISAVLLPGDVAAAAGHALVDYARDHEIDLVVVGSRGLGALKRSLMSMMGLGSTSDHIAHTLACPLIVVKSNPAAAEAAEGPPPASIHTAIGNNEVPPDTPHLPSTPAMHTSGLLLDRLDEEPPMSPVVSPSSD